MLVQYHASHVTRHTSRVTCHMSHVTRHTSHVTRQTSHVTRHTSHVTRHTSHVTCNNHRIFCQAFTASIVIPENSFSKPKTCIILKNLCRSHAAAVAALRNARDDGAHYSRNVIRVHGVAEGGRVCDASRQTQHHVTRHTAAAASPHAAVVHGLRPLPQLTYDGRDRRLVQAAGEVV